MRESRTEVTTPQSSRDDIPVEHGHSSAGQPRSLADRLLPLSVLLVGFVARLVQANEYFLNPDEALHYLLASQPSLGLAYRAALTNAHPPLLILVLYYWRVLGHSELMLRMPSVLAGTACCWITYEWLKLVADRSTALTGLLLLALSPSLIELSAEIRQYALLLFFMSACLYLSERAIRDDSIPEMIWFSLALYGALLTHYSSLIFALTLGLYMLMRLYPYGKLVRLVAVWGVGQVGALGLTAYYLITHVAGLRRSGMAKGIAETWLRKSIYSGENHAAVFVAAQTLRVFTYLLSQGVGGTLALAAFLVGIVLLLNKRSAEKRPTGRELALLLGLPFMVNCGLGLAGLYPYGGTRHNAVLALFGFSGAAIGLAAWKPRRTWVRPMNVALCLALCNFFPAPPPQIRARNHGRILMEKAVDSLRGSATAGSILFADYQSALLLGYYVCGHGVVQTFPPLQSFTRSDCGPYMVITTRFEEWKFNASDLPGQLAGAARIYNLPPETKLWLFDAGWIADSAPALRGPLREIGCLAPWTFGENILLCQIAIGGKGSKN
jgi:Dolichyl-phosphate-mannose-protein mannosyltransferase